MTMPMFSYLFIITQCCCFLKVTTGQTCGTFCKSCNNATQCLECMPGYYGSRCQFRCNLCKGGECTIEECTDGCRDGYFVEQAGTPCEPCNNECTMCSSYTECSLCKDGYYGQACKFPCKSCIPCSKINGSCLTTTPDLTSQSTQPYNTPSVKPVFSSSIATALTTFQSSMIESTSSATYFSPTTFKVTTIKPTTSAPSYTLRNSAPSSTPTTSAPSSTPRNSAPSSTPTTSAPSSTPTMFKIYLGVGILVVLVIAAIVVVVVIRRRNKKEKIYRLQASRESHDQTGFLMTENVAYVSADECLSDRPVVYIGGNNCSDTLDAVYSMPTKTAHVPITSQDSKPTSQTNEITFQTTAPPIPVKSEGYLDDETSSAPAKETTDNELNYSSVSHL